MIKRNQRFLNIINAVSDGVIVLGTYLLSAWIWLDLVKKDANMASLSNFRHSLAPAACIYAVMVVLIYAMFRMYNSLRVRRIRYEIIAVWEANALGLLGVGALLFLLRLQDFSRGVLALFYLSSSVLVSAKRIGLRYVLHSLRKRGFNQKHIVIVGTGALAQQFARNVRALRNAGLHVKGFIGQSRSENSESYLGDFATLEAQLQDTGVDEVVVALEPDEIQYVRSAIATCEKCGTKVSVVPFYNNIIPASPTIEIIGDSKLINLRSNPLDNLGLAALKRLFDIVASLLLLVLLCPLFLIVAIGTKLSSPGPVFFLQKRVGRGKKLFTMVKFRSMRVNTTQDTAWSKNEDPRKTRFGSLLRKLSIDELPQLFNVLKGDMSLVGPRPEIPFYVEQFKESVPLYMVKHQVRPGMTGWAQVNGYRGDTSIVKRIEHDIWYIENWSVSLDIKILFMTALGGWMNKEKLVAGKDDDSATPAA